MMAFSTFTISLLYMIPQLVAAGLLIRLMLNIDYSISVLIIGGLMTVYVVFGGLIATSWVQMVKTIVLMSGTFFLFLIVFSRFCWNIPYIIETVNARTPLGKNLLLPGHI